MVTQIILRKSGIGRSNYYTVPWLNRKASASALSKKKLEQKYISVAGVFVLMYYFKKKTMSISCVV